MKLCNFILLALLVLYSTNNYAGGIRPSFNLDHCSWDATDIIVATEGNVIDGDFIVLEPIKGQLLTGEIISVPELAKFKSKASRLVKSAFVKEGQEICEYVGGQRMILFLKRKTQPKLVSAEEVGASNLSSVWAAASRDGINVSVVWLEREKSFAFIQLENPGGSILTEYGKSEQQIKERALEVIQTQKSLDEIGAIEDKSQKAEALVPFISSPLYFASRIAFEELEKCGEKAALPVLRRILNDDSKLNLHGRIVESLSLIGGEKVGSELTEIVREEMLFWKLNAPHLEKGWWNKINESETETLRNRYSKMLKTLYALQKLKFAGSKEVVAEFRDFWRLLPQLESKSGLNQMSEACDNVLKELSELQ